MIHIPLILLLATPGPDCTAAQTIFAGQVSNCSGVIWSAAATREALKCRRVSLPVSEANLLLCRQSSKAIIAATSARAVSAESLLRLAPKRPPAWVLPATAVGSVALGVVIGFLVGATR